MRPTFLALVVVALAPSACSTTLPDPAIPEPSAELERVAADDPRGSGYAIAVKVAACWLGDRWGETLGERGEALREGTAARCKEAMAAAGIDPSVAAKDALAPANVDAVADEVALAARADEHERPYTRELVAFVRSVATEARETSELRRGGPAPTYEALAMLVHMRGPYAPDAHVIGLAEAIAREEIYGRPVGELGVRLEAACNELETRTPLDAFGRAVAARAESVERRASRSTSVTSRP